MQSASVIFKTNEILASILGFFPFEEQIGSLRLVNRKFKKTCEQIVEEKFFDKIKVIAYDTWPDSWFKAQVRRGWSDDSCTSKESCIEDALAMASCRCCSYNGDCAFNNNTKTNQENCKKQALRQTADIPNYWMNNKMSLDEARMLLNSQGWFRVTEQGPNGEGSAQIHPATESVQIRFEECNEKS